MCTMFYDDFHTVCSNLSVASYSTSLYVCTYIKHNKHADVSQQAEIVRLLRSIARARNTKSFKHRKANHGTMDFDGTTKFCLIKVVGRILKHVIQFDPLAYVAHGNEDAVLFYFLVVVNNFLPFKKLSTGNGKWY
ncbi:uncharacterized protein LOC123989295 [Osmia bicornis bicornis]|uniref:uncharacterized protein LOC123989295 n=1 Tax=Osmia bicornis bicornis TaxID=1437191 RepID=UPI001EAEB21A|nr:uncharacterized protein LOC123989295 [Osmia bicornis bicornis]